jgi:hypothetical protein
VTERKGSPQTLVCTKNQATYKRRLAQFNVDVQLLKDLAGAEMTRGNGALARPPARTKRVSAKAQLVKKHRR